MKLYNITNKSVMAIFIAITLFACEGNYQKIKQLNTADLGPVTEGKGINLKYTDSGRLVANLITTKLLDFSNYTFSFSEFPEGLEVQFWKDTGKKTTVTADYGINYNKTGLIDLRGNVVLITSDSVILHAQQMYWDQKNKWIFTDQPYKIKFKDGSYNDGGRFDSNEEFNNFLSRKNVGVQFVDKTKLESKPETEQ
ncbi:MAG: LPS export ABC transporter periplasmic protein LptC [Flavobacteriaceae bacterium CG_4_8_14_3_um_filter_34_10]|nr:MAG: LPS export ABC transporter periplasmic protein LptC [Flavobacteriaceae bacterium CG2_30_34_30]PIQ16942.1 MAG: LPS export ABC transporter periplasmic protein LptC [Flavobacteriaceae bacterium CG18_big_fil_WC_8_21_14_2_50_34_36]PIV51641.1 MAG: LPS export ABC transporter periplasmic protein LptC [Flavobacteriaceae bacterium CG02_land_8_20_14_3_00_34_13]PIX10661.1 MAG: LPS export ABC transporter periplasmic protein LptC [Flavobacteriaceae bacterium CG_4_8_14_3_um_filter_34_10]PIZ07937.1 MAG